MKRTPEDTMARAEASRIAGAKGRSAKPMNPIARAENYWAAAGGRGMTPGQRRRWIKKQLRSGVVARQMAGVR